MNEEQYIKSRVDDQIEWYDRRSAANQRWFRQLRVVEIVAAAAVPLLAGYAESAVSIRIAVGILGLLIAVIAGVFALYQFQETWTAYRNTCEGLKQEKYLFLTKTEPYGGGEPFPLFVQRVEALLTKEHSGWMESTRNAGRETKQE